MCQQRACRDPKGVLLGNPWQQLLLSHFPVQGGLFLAVKPIPLACLKHSGDYERGAFCSVVCVQTYLTICLLQDLVHPEGMSLKRGLI